ncbi:hypothetical protein [Paracoccus benzoatiresistens]|uniref:ACT domain-containing protein n=1 Tax=Paracoccus benzoatiresistens TaxID=2997341 RepID=A0ABT4J8C5_9RHOB|nr:hypothetical protein [Paracoccus sp. EF6]MCZ0963332.1 hypothetical protein [Paracoccus sp. EF6]
MKDVATQAPITAVTVPIKEVAQHRRDFPGSQISFHLELDCPGLASLAALCQILEAAGLRMVTLKAGANGNVYCVLRDDGQADLSCLAQELGRSATLNRWTTQIGC